MSTTIKREGLVKEFTYYNGPIFEAYVDGVGEIVGSGGRYDELLGKFGYDCPAVGFAFNVTLIHRALMRRGAA